MLRKRTCILHSIHPGAYYQKWNPWYNLRITAVTKSCRRSTFWPLLGYLAPLKALKGYNTRKSSFNGGRWVSKAAKSHLSHQQVYRYAQNQVCKVMQNFSKMSDRLVNLWSHWRDLNVEIHFDIFSASKIVQIFVLANI